MLCMQEKGGANYSLPGKSHFCSETLSLWCVGHISGSYFNIIFLVFLNLGFHLHRTLSVLKRTNRKYSSTPGIVIIKAPITCLDQCYTSSHLILRKTLTSESYYLPILQMRKLQIRKAEYFAQCHMAHESRAGIWSQVRLMPKSYRLLHYTMLPGEPSLHLGS